MKRCRHDRLGPAAHGAAQAWPDPGNTVGSRSSFLLLLTTLFGVAAFGWPLLIHQSAGQNTAHSGDAPWIFVGLLPLLLAIVMAELSEGAIDAKAVALLGILAACFAALAGAESRHQRVRARMVSPHTGGARLRAWVRLRPRCRRVLRVGIDHRWGGPVVALPDAGGRVGRIRRRLPATDAGIPGAAAAGGVRRGLRPRLRAAHQFLVLALRRGRRRPTPSCRASAPRRTCTGSSSST